MKELTVVRGDLMWSTRKGLGVVVVEDDMTSHPIGVRFMHTASCEVEVYTRHGLCDEEDLFPEISFFDITKHKPAFHVNAPILVMGLEKKYLRRRFAGWPDKGVDGILVFPNGTDSWTCKSTAMPSRFVQWCLPSEDDLEDVYEAD